MPDAKARVVTRLLSDVAYERIRRDILRSVLPPAAAITEARLALRYRLGKAPVRAALARLAQDGLVRAVPRGGYEVAPVTMRDVHDLFELWRIFEPAAARMAAGRVDAGALRRLDTLCQAGYAALDGASVAAFLEASTEFHVTIVRASGNERLAEAVLALLGDMERLLHLGLAVRDRSVEVQHERRSLVRALAAGDRAAAERIAAEQIDAAYRMVVESVMSSPGLFDVDLARA